jgi:hypothetical protein
MPSSTSAVSGGSGSVLLIDLALARSMTRRRSMENSQVRMEPSEGSNRSRCCHARTNVSCAASSASCASPKARRAKPTNSPLWARNAARSPNSSVTISVGPGRRGSSPRTVSRLTAERSVNGWRRSWMTHASLTSHSPILPHCGSCRSIVRPIPRRIRANRHCRIPVVRRSWSGQPGQPGQPPGPSARTTCRRDPGRWRPSDWYHRRTGRGAFPCR